MVDAKRIARERGATRIDVVANPQAVAFYEAVGFKPAGEVQTRFGAAPRMTLTLGREIAMADVDEFLADALPPLTAADTAIHNGEAGPRIALWSHNDPVSLFGALQVKTGWREIEPIFEWVASQFSSCESFEYEVLAAGVSGDLAYIAGIEHTTAAAGDAPAQAYDLRVTTVFRREGGEWRVIHRHADPVPDSEPTHAQLGRLSEAQRDR